jgi:uncharacterized protein YrrD
VQLVFGIAPSGWPGSAAVTYEEQTPGWMANMARAKTVTQEIAAIVLSRDATLLSMNLSDCRKVPGLKVADWTVAKKN